MLETTHQIKLSQTQAEEVLTAIESLVFDAGRLSGQS